jgi:hypothetical protein
LEPFREHVFISYAHRDNRPTFDDKGWVTRFDEIFRDYLGVRLGADPIVWRDGEKVQGNSALTDEILNGLANSALLITVISPSYINSEWCRKELRSFCDHASASGDLVIDRKSRVLKVVKLPPATLDHLPEEVQDSTGYQFYREFEEGYIDELDPANDDDMKQFKKAIVRLAADAERLINQLRLTTQSDAIANVSRDGASPALGTHAIRIYLADCTYDLRETRERLAADLKQRGCLVFPDKPLPSREQLEYCTAVRQACQECDISIHMIGSRYGAIPETPEPRPRSVVELQNGIAAELARSAESGRSLRRLIWMPAQLQPGDPMQRSFVERLDQEADLQVGADLIRGDFEELRTTVARLIKAHSQAMAAPEPSGPANDLDSLHTSSDSPMVYLVCTQEDLSQTLDLKRWLREQGFEVERPLFEGDATEVRNANQALLRRCCAVVYFYGAGTDAWFRSVRTDLRKINIHRQGLPPIPRAIYVAEPNTALKQEQLDDPDQAFTAVIDGRRGFDPGALTSLLRDVSHSGAQLDA